MIEYTVLYSDISVDTVLSMQYLNNKKKKKKKDYGICHRSCGYTEVYLS